MKLFASRRTATLSITLALTLSGCFGLSAGTCAPVDLLAENFDNYAVGRLASGAGFGPGRDGQALQLDGNAAVVYEGVQMPRAKGRIEMDVCLHKPIGAGSHERHFMLLTDVGAAGAWRGATVVYWDKEDGHFRYGVYDAGWHWLSAPEAAWTVGAWHHLAISFGPEGRTLEIDGTAVARDEYTQGIAPRTMRLGTMDGYSVSAPVLVDNFVVSYEPVDELRVDRAVLCPTPDGLLDELGITWSLAETARVSMEAVSASGDLRRTVLKPGDYQPGQRKLAFSGADLPSGSYALRLTITRPGEADKTLEAPLSVDRELSWRPAGELMRDYFPLGVWYFWEEDASYINRHVDDDNKAQEYYRRTTADLAGLGINTIIGNWTPRDHRGYLLDEAHKRGIKVIVHLDEVNSYLWQPDRLATGNFVQDICEAVSTAKDHPATLGYYLVDEPAPTPENIGNIRMARQVVEALDPDRPGFSCLNTGWETIYPQVGYQVLLVDIYPVYSNRLKGNVLQGYIGAVDRARRAASDGPLWVIPQAFGFKHRKGSIPTPNELSLMVWEAVAHGAKGIIYFIYQSTTQIQGEWLRGLVGMDLEPMDHRHEEVRRINAALKPIAETLLSLKWRDNTFATCDPGIDVQAFANAQDETYLCVVNQSTEEGAEATLVFEPEWAEVVTGLVDVATGATSPADKLIPLEPSEGRLLKVIAR